MDPLIKALNDTIHAEANNHPAPTMCTISKVHADGHVDAKLWSNDETLEYLKVIGNPAVNEDAIVFFIDGKLETPVIVAK